MSKEALKIVTIGGGSSYTPELIEGYILRKDELPIKEIWLVDIEAGKEKLEIVGAMAKRQVEAAGLDWEVHLTLDRFNALKDADFVTTQFRVGLLNARIKDERIPLSHGVLGQETNGAGGMFKAFRTIPIIGQIIADMRLQCPDAWLINFTNPYISAVSIRVMPNCTPKRKASISSCLFAGSSPKYHVPCPTCGMMLPSGNATIRLAFSFRRDSMICSSMFVIYRHHPFCFRHHSLHQVYLFLSLIQKES